MGKLGHREVERSGVFSGNQCRSTRGEIICSIWIFDYKRAGIDAVIIMRQ